MTTSPLRILAVFARLGCLSFGGPVAHLAYFREEFVQRRRWLDEATFGECVALTQLLPGPSSSQTGMLVGWLRGGPAGALAAWIGFTTPSAVLMAAFALATPRWLPPGPIHALLLVAAAVVASAVVTMRSTLAPDALRLCFAMATLVLVLSVHVPVVGPLAIAGGAVAGAFFLRGRVDVSAPKLDLRISARAGIAVLIAFAVVFFGLDVLARGTHSNVWQLCDVLFRVGSLVFGGGHVVLPLLQRELATNGMLSNNALLAGYAAAQAMPGPLFTIASFVGASAFGGALGWRGAIAGTLAIFAPSFFLLAGVAPFYRKLSESRTFRAGIAGTNASVVGLLSAALVTPIGTSAIHSWLDAAIALGAFAVLTLLRWPAWVLVAVAALAGFFFRGV